MYIAAKLTTGTVCVWVECQRRRVVIIIWQATPTEAHTHTTMRHWFLYRCMMMNDLAIEPNRLARSPVDEFSSMRSYPTRFLHPLRSPLHPVTRSPVCKLGAP